MIDQLTIENFKCFTSKKNIDLAKITACVGMNSVGKSSLIQAVLLLRQAYEILQKYIGTNQTEFVIPINQKYALNLGETNQIISAKESEKISLTVNNIALSFGEGANGASLVFNKSKMSERLLKSNIFHNEFYYLNAERIGPRNYQNMENYADNEGYSTCGCHGEYTFDVVENYGRFAVSEGRLFAKDKNKVNKLEKQLEYWLSYIVPGIEIKFSSDHTMRLSQMKVRQTSFDTNFESPYNFGFGISYVLPIIVTGLLAAQNSIFIVENPEAHLHPSGQSRIGRFLSQIAADGVQVIIETHSEHVINGIRINALQNEIPSKNVCINYFSIDDKGNHHIEHIQLNDRMDIMKWPTGFFDQEEQDLQELRHLRSK